MALLHAPGVLLLLDVSQLKYPSLIPSILIVILNGNVEFTGLQ